MNRNNIIRMIPLLIMFLLSVAIATGMFNKDNNDAIDTVNNGKQFTNFELPSLAKDAIFSPKLFGGGRVLVVNVFASWCVPCASEHELLMKLAQKVNIYGVAWKDKPEDTLRYLSERGNPFQQIGIDESGQTTVPMAITGVPETFVLDKNGAIMLHYKAPITEEILTELIIPLVTTLNTQNVSAR